MSPRYPLLLILLVACSAPQTAPSPSIDDAFRRARDRVYPALVHVQPIRETFVGGRRRLSTTTGSGVIIDDRGHVITNYHVSGEAEESYCTLSTKERIRAVRVGGDPLTDIAVIRLDPEELEAREVDLRWADLGESDDLEVGQWVLSMGSPLGFSRTMSQGIVSNTERVFPEADLRLQGGERTGFFNTWIQTTAPINPGNSGGPLVDLEGKVIGINARAALFANNLGFAIPVDTVKEVVQQILRDGRVIRSTIGLQCQPLTELVGRYGESGGVLVAGVVPGSPADRAGFRAGDLITSYDGRRISARTDEEFPRACKVMADVPVGEMVEVVALRDQGEVRFRVETREMGKSLGEEREIEGWGLTVQGITDEMARLMRLQTKEGVLVTGVVPGGRSYSCTPDLLPGDVFRFIDGEAVPDIADLEEALRRLEAESKERSLLKVWRDGVWRLLVLEPGFDRSAEEVKE